MQMNSTADRARNLATAGRLVAEAAARGARLVVLPEKWPALGEPHPSADGEAYGRARELARECAVDLIAGSMLLPAGEDASGRKLANVSVHFGPGGDEVARYAKLHMFDATIDGTAYRESAGEQPGSGIVVTELADGGPRTGLSVCYDVRFPELYRSLSARGASLITIPSAFTLATTRDHWEVLVRARAIENLCFVIAPNQVGERGDGKRSGGRSLIVDPWGVVLAGASDGEGVLVADLDLRLLARVRESLPALENRRGDLFGEVRG